MSERRHEWTDPETGWGLCFVDGDMWWSATGGQRDDWTPEPGLDGALAFDIPCRYAAHLAAECDAKDAEISRLAARLAEVEAELQHYRAHYRLLIGPEVERSRAAKAEREIAALEAERDKAAESAYARGWRDAEQRARQNAGLLPRREGSE